METKGTITKETDLLTMEQAADYLGYKKGYLYPTPQIWCKVCTI